MHIEYEATFTEVDVEAMRRKLEDVGGV